MAGDAPISFAVEKTLGKLAKWLRILGFDTICELELGRAQFETAIGAGRILLTRTRKDGLASRAGKVILIESDHLEAQLRQVVRVLDLRPVNIRLFSRCTHCNIPIKKVDKGKVQGRVPDYVWETQDDFSACPSCCRIYWPGSHTARSAEFVKRLFGDLESDSTPTLHKQHGKND